MFMPDEQNLNQSPIPQHQPGTVITPGYVQPADQPVPPVATPAPIQQLPAQPQPEQVPIPQVVTQPEAALPIEPESQGYYAAENVEADEEDQEEKITWTAPEFAHHIKNASWYLGLAVSIVLLAALFYLITKSFVSVGVVVVAGIILGVYGSHKPRLLTYSLSDYGIIVGNRMFNYAEFRSFSVIREAELGNVTLMPLGRFSPPASLYYKLSEENVVLNFLSQRLPFEDRRPDVIDTLMRKIKF
jgi:hypothetical protein